MPLVMTLTTTTKAIFDLSFLQTRNHKSYYNSNKSYPHRLNTNFISTLQPVVIILM